MLPLSEIASFLAMTIGNLIEGNSTVCLSWMLLSSMCSTWIELLHYVQDDIPIKKASLWR
jgi:hypothetical protein